jgi:HAD superfamily hydrolase (TIGR01509 family)
MFSAILWDMDGTLVDTERVVWDVMREAFQRAVAIDLPEPLFESLMGQSENDFYAAMAQRFSLDAAKIDSIREVFDAAYLPMLAKVPPLPGAVEKVTEFARHAPQALVTGSTSEQAATVLDTLGITESFLHVIGCDRYSRGKPDPEPFLLAAERLEVDPASCLCIEDSPSGVTAARKAGMKVVGVHAGNQGKYDISHAHVQLESLHDLELDAIIDALNASL